MAKPTTTAKAVPFQRASIWVASVIALALGAIAATFIQDSELGRSLELWVSDVLRKANPLPDDSRSVQTVVIEIDDATLAFKPGGPWRWPWPRPVQGEVVETLAAMEPRMIVLDVEYTDAQRECVGRRPTPQGGLERYIIEEPDEHFAHSIRRAGNVVMAFSMHLEERAARRGGTGARAVGMHELPAWMKAHALGVRPDRVPGIMPAESYNKLIEPLCEVARGVGYTSVIKDVDNTLRRVPLLARGEDVVFPHLAMEIAGHWLFGPDYRVRFEEGRLRLSSADDDRGSVSVPVDEKLQLSLRWPRDQAMVTRLSAMRVLRARNARRAVRNLEPKLRATMTELAALWPEAGWQEARRALDAAEARAAEKPQSGSLAEEVRRVRARLEEARRQLGDNLMRYFGTSPEEVPQGLERKRARAAATHIPTLREYLDAEAEAERLLEELRPEIKGRVCILGINATGLTDQHKTPISGAQAGVTVYEIAARTILSGVAFQRLPEWSEWVMAVLAAWLVAAATIRLPTGWGVAAAVALSGAVFGIAWLTADRVAFLLPVAGPVLALLVAFGGVSAYRQLTEEHARRWATSVAKQFVPPEHVEQIARHPEMLRLGGERRDISVIFSDVRGFTPLSEKLEPDQLNQLLYEYLGAMTGIIYREQGTLDKYEGDGIMAFFGAPIPLEDHALLAVRAALGMHEALPEINARLREMGLLPPEREVRIRVGCSTGPAMVGNFGAEQRFNYTAMGDTVNLGGRLEEANRWVGSRVLVPEPTRQGCGEAVLFRPFGPATIRGKAEGVTLYEPLATEPAPEELRQLAEAFGRAVEALNRGDLDAAEAALAEVFAVREDDEPGLILKERVEAARRGEGDGEAFWNLAERSK